MIVLGLWIHDYKLELRKMSEPRIRDAAGVTVAIAMVLVNIVGAAALGAPVSGAQCDFDADSHADAAVGVPHESIGTSDSAGAVKYFTRRGWSRNL